MRILWITVIVLWGCFAATAASESDAQKAFTRLKMLTGTWEGKSADGKTVSANYQLAAGGTSLMQESSEDHMVTMFYVVGERLVLTHYCGTGTQPRMQASVSPDGKTIAFDFVDGTNIPTLESGHMHRAVFTLTDANHYIEEWTWMQGGKSSVVEHFEMSRKQ
jgi:hypothetical protein